MPRAAGRAQPLLAGVVTALVGFASSFTVVLTGLRASGADESQAASGLLALSLACAVVAVLLGLRTRLPISIAWSTPGAALLISTGVPEGGFPAAVGAFLITGVLIVLAGTLAPLGRLIAAIPAHLASAMLAGVLLQLCLAPVRALGEVPALAAPVILTWLLLSRFARPWAVPAALVVAVAGILISGPELGGVSLLPTLGWVTPEFTVGAVVGIALPLFVVTMASQNVPGMAVLAQYGYRPALRPILLTTGLATVAGAPFGGHAVNLAAISAALAAGPDAGPDRSHRWIASVTAGVGLGLLGLLAGVAGALLSVAPPVLIEAVAGLALLGALASALMAAFSAPPPAAPPTRTPTPTADPAHGGAPTRWTGGRLESAAVTFVVTAAGTAFIGIGSAFWGLVAGVAVQALLRRRDTSTA